MIGTARSAQDFVPSKNRVVRLVYPARFSLAGPMDRRASLVQAMAGRWERYNRRRKTGPEQALPQDETSLTPGGAIVSALLQIIGALYRLR
jgi:hypothetical protein